MALAAKSSRRRELFRLILETRQRRWNVLHVDHVVVELLIEVLLHFRRHIGPLAHPVLDLGVLDGQGLVEPDQQIESRRRHHASPSTTAAESAATSTSATAAAAAGTWCPAATAAAGSAATASAPTGAAAAGEGPHRHLPGDRDLLGPGRIDECPLNFLGVPLREVLLVPEARAPQGGRDHSERKSKPKRRPSTGTQDGRHNSPLCGKDDTIRLRGYRPSRLLQPRTTRI